MVVLTEWVTQVQGGDLGLWDGIGGGRGKGSGLGPGLSWLPPWTGGGPSPRWGPPGEQAW